MSQQEALHKLHGRSGTQWDPEVVALFLYLIEQNKLTLISLATPLDDLT